MAIDIIVRRGAADKSGSDIVNGLLATLEVAKNRGRNELDEQATIKVPVRYESVFRAGLATGQLVEVANSLVGKVFRGKIAGITHRVQETTAITELTLLRVSDDQ